MNTNDTKGSLLCAVPENDDSATPASRHEVLDEIALIANNYRAGHGFRERLKNWFAFLGGRPGQVIIVDHGNPEETHAELYAAYCEGLIDKLFLVGPGCCDLSNGEVPKGEQMAVLVATKPYLLWFGIDTVPFRQGQERWLTQAVGYLENDEVFAVGEPVNDNAECQDAWPGWCFADSCSINFTLMKRSACVVALQEFCGEYVSSGFMAHNPPAGQNGHLLELAWRQYMARHQKFLLTPEKTPDWRIEVSTATGNAGERLTKHQVQLAPGASENHSVSANPAGANPLDQIALIGLNFGDGQVFRHVLRDWFAFLGGRPGEVVIVDNGSTKDTHATVYDAFCEGMIDKLLLVQHGHCDTGNHQVHIGAHTSAAIATKPYLLWFRVDVLPFRQGHEKWLSRAIASLDREDVFAFGGSFNLDSKHHEAWPGWYFSHKCSENFSLMKRSEFMRAMQEFCGEYISSGFRGPNPATRQERHLVEVAWERYIQRHRKYTLVREEDPSWTVFHTNVHGDRLVKVRARYLARKRVAKYLNAGCNGSRQPGSYYGQPLIATWLKHLRTRFGESPLGPCWRTLKKSLAEH